MGETQPFAARLKSSSLASSLRLCCMSSPSPSPGPTVDSPMMQKAKNNIYIKKTKVPIAARVRFAGPSLPPCLSPNLTV